ncbi:flavin reductase family protein [Aeromicrobium sp. Leaf350]|uniref:flavin reductase family protein n=1 Tax=Aeromicrobium sp. Leaf350 TaxID=2876565 RepID=UPI001E48CEC9|nr:flavin reductase family protein [Aeromicrobium sp. Leaf350]
MPVTSSVPDTSTQRAFRDAMGNVTASVSVVTTLTDGVPHGTTVSAFMSLSMDPPKLTFALDRGSNLLSRLTVDSIVGVNVLAAHHDQVALRFAGKGDDKFADVPWRLENGAPALVDRHAWVALRISQLVEAGDHVLLIGDVIGADSTPSAPLTYWKRTFGTHQAF